MLFATTHKARHTTALRQTSAGIVIAEVTGPGVVSAGSAGGTSSGGAGGEGTGEDDDGAGAGTGDVTGSGGEGEPGGGVVKVDVVSVVSSV